MSNTMEKYVAFNFVTGKDEPIPDKDRNGLTSAWVEGWDCCMYNGLSSNPYDQATLEGHDWQDGYDAAIRD
jgi:hypothetical protein